MNKKLKNQLWRIPLVLTAVSAIVFLFVYSTSGIPDKSSINLYWKELGNQFPWLAKTISSNIELPQVMRIYDIPSVFLMTMVIILFFQSIETTCRSAHFIDILSLKFRSTLAIIGSAIFIAFSGLIGALFLLVFLFLYDFLHGTFGKNHKASFVPIFIMVATGLGSGLGSTIRSGPTLGLLVMLFCIVIFLIFGLLANTGKHLNKQNSKKFYKWLAGE